jgi:hypothetical protein
MRIKTFLIILLLCAAACKSKKQEAKEIPFDKTKWLVKEEKQYPYRDQMLNDVIKNYTAHGIKRDSILKLLGPPTKMDTGFLFYRISQSFFLNIPHPIHTKTLVIAFNPDSTLKWRKIHE